MRLDPPGEFGFDLLCKTGVRLLGALTPSRRPLSAKSRGHERTLPNPSSCQPLRDFDTAVELALVVELDMENFG